MKAVDLETIIENTQANLALFDRNFNFILVNSAYARGSGYSRISSSDVTTSICFPISESGNLRTGSRYR